MAWLPDLTVGKLKLRRIDNRILKGRPFGLPFFFIVLLSVKMKKGDLIVLGITGMK